MILVIVEDSDDDFDTVCEAVKQSGVAVEVQRATTGGGGLVLLGKLAAARSAPVLMNLNTPGTDGCEALAAIKANPTLKAIPVVAFSTSANPRDVGSVTPPGSTRTTSSRSATRTTCNSSSILSATGSAASSCLRSEETTHENRDTTHSRPDVAGRHR